MEHNKVIMGCFYDKMEWNNKVFVAIVNNLLCVVILT